MDSSVFATALHWLEVMRGLLGGVNATVLGYGLLAALGASLISANLSLFGEIRLPRIGGGIDLERRFQELQGDGAGHESGFHDNLPLLDRVLGPAVRSAVKTLPHQEDAWTLATLDLLNYPNNMKSPSDYYAARVFYGMIGFAIGVLSGAFDLFTSDSLFGLCLYPLAMGLLGYLYPKSALNGALKRRRDQMLFEAPYLFDRLSVAIAANQNSLMQGMKETVTDDVENEETRRERLAEQEMFMRTQILQVTSVPEGGYLMRELRLVVERCMIEQMPLADSLHIMAERNGDVALVEQFSNRMSMLDRAGLSVADALRLLGDRAAEMVEDLIEARAAENTALMITPTLISLVGIALVIVGPSMKALDHIFL